MSLLPNLWYNLTVRNLVLGHERSQNPNLDSEHPCYSQYQLFVHDVHHKLTHDDCLELHHAHQDSPSHVQYRKFTQLFIAASPATFPPLHGCDVGDVPGFWPRMLPRSLSKVACSSNVPRLFQRPYGYNHHVKTAQEFTADKTRASKGRLNPRRSRTIESHVAKAGQQRTSCRVIGRRIGSAYVASWNARKERAWSSQNSFLSRKEIWRAKE